VNNIRGLHHFGSIVVLHPPIILEENKPVAFGHNQKRLVRGLTLRVEWLYFCLPIVVFCMSLGAVSPALAQSTFGSIRGTIQDSSSAFIPGAVVTVHSLDENFDRQVTTNDSGDFVVENLKLAATN